jgi:hypothetical protein
MLRIELLPDYQRIVVNPFLAVVDWVATVALIDAGVRRRSLTLFLCGLVLLFIGFLLPQFHCLDCGATGWLYRFRGHACPSVVARYESGEERRFGVPRVPAQITIWVYFLAGALLFWLLVLAAPRR